MRNYYLLASFIQFSLTVNVLEECLKFKFEITQSGHRSNVNRMDYQALH